MNRFTYEWEPFARKWRVHDNELGLRDVAAFDTLAETEAYCIERQSRTER